MTSDPPILRSSILAAGTGAPVLLLHGSASAAVMWVPVIDALKSRFRVIAPDLIGYGRTDSWPDGHGFSVDEELRLVEPLLSPAPVGVHVVGHSYGGVVALHLALAGRVPIRSLTLIEPVAFFLLPHAGAQAAWLEIKGLGDDYTARIAAGETETALRGFIDYWAGRGAWDAMDESLRAQIRRSARKIVLDFEVTFTDPAMQGVARAEMSRSPDLGRPQPDPHSTNCIISCPADPGGHARYRRRCEPPAAGDACRPAACMPAAAIGGLKRLAGPGLLLRSPLAKVRAWMTALLQPDNTRAMSASAPSVTTGRGTR